MIAILGLSPQLQAQQAETNKPDVNSAILHRLEDLEKQNQELLEQIKQLRDMVAQQQSTKSQQSIEERQEVTEHRVEELAQTKVEASQRYPVQLTGTALFNAFSNTAYGGTAQNPTVAVPDSGARNSGASFRQTVLGLTFQGPRTFAGGAVSGSIYMDFFGGTAQSLNQLLRLRVATVQVDWPNTTFAVGQDKPIVSQREPNSLAQIGVSPLTGAGNPWLWKPQARIQQKFKLGAGTTAQAEFGIFQTAETANQTSSVASRVESARPAFETRVALRHQFATDGAVVEVAPVFHTSTSHILGHSVPSMLYGLDWLVQPCNKLEVTGLAFHGENFANLGALGGITVTSDERVHAIRGSGGWFQLRYKTTNKLTFDLYGGLQDNTNRDMDAGAIGRNQYLAANLMYLLAPNVIAAFEYGQNRTDYLGLGNRINRHYDLALGYLF